MVPAFHSDDPEPIQLLSNSFPRLREKELLIEAHGVAICHARKEVCNGNFCDLSINIIAPMQRQAVGVVDKIFEQLPENTAGFAELIFDSMGSVNIGMQPVPKFS